MTTLREVLGRFLPRALRAMLRRHFEGRWSVSGGYAVLATRGAHANETGFLQKKVAERQGRTFQPILEQLRSGHPRADFRALAEAMRLVAVVNPLIVEIGCGSGWNSEVIARLTGKEFRYVGIDYSRHMTRLGSRTYPKLPFVVGDATRLPLKDAICDVLLSGTVLMHVPDYDRAIRESRRVTRRWCVFHTVPILKQKQTQFLRKNAYGEPVVEIIFNEQELLSMFTGAGLVVRRTFDSLDYDLEHILGERTETKTYLCEVS